MVLHQPRHPIGVTNSRHFFIQSEVNPKPFVTRSPSFTRACQRCVITSSSDWFTGLSVSVMIGSSDYFGFFYVIHLKTSLVTIITSTFTRGQVDESLKTSMKAFCSKQRYQYWGQVRINRLLCFSFYAVVCKYMRDLFAILTVFLFGRCFSAS